MQINVKLVGAFRLGRFKEEVRDYRAGTSIQDVITSLQLPEQILGIVLVNGVHAEFADILQEGDSLTILPILDGG
jgi:sulfur carrier protein ThiS